MRRKRAQDGDKHDQDRSCGQLVAQELQGHIPGKAFRHDARADNGRDKQRRPQEFSRRSSLEIEYHLRSVTRL